MAVFAAFAQFASLSVFLFVVFFGFGLAFFGLPSPSFSGELSVSPVAAAPVAAPSRRRSVARSYPSAAVLVVPVPAPALPALVPPAPGAVLGCSVACVSCPVFAGVPSLPCALAAGGCPRLAASSGRPLAGAALAGRVRSLVRSGVFVVA
jgi:hypothetical protein